MKKSQQFLAYTFAFILGIASGKFITMRFFYAYIIMLCLFVSIFFIPKKFVRFSIILVLLLLAGTARYNFFSKIPTNDTSTFGGKKAEIAGVLCEEPDERIGSVKLTLCADTITVNGTKNTVSGKVLVSARLYPKYQYGDALKILGNLTLPENFNDFAYDKYLARYGIYSVMYYPEITIVSRNNGNYFYSTIYKFKNYIIKKIRMNVAEPQASIINAFFLGSRGRIPDELNQAFKTAGIIHLIAISGSHITLLMVMLEMLLPFFYVSKNKAFYFISIAIVFYILLIGAPASAVRAAIMGWVFLFAKKIGRFSKAFNILFITATVMLFLNPKLLFDDIGFQLSFLALWGIIEFIPRWEEKFSQWPEIFGLKGIMFMTMASQIATFPILAYNFKTLSLIAPVTNLFILPVFTYFMGITIVSIFASLFLPQFGILLFFVPYLFVSYMMGASIFFSKLPYASIPFETFSLEVMAVSYLLIIYFTYGYKIKLQEKEIIQNKKNNFYQVFKYAGLAIFIIFFVYVSAPYAYAPKNKNTQAIFFNVGQGDSALIKTQSGKIALMDGGPDNTVLYKIAGYLPWWGRNIDEVIISHPHADHITGLVELLRRYNVGKIVLTDVSAKTPEEDALMQIIREKNINMEKIRATSTEQFDNNVWFTYVYPKTDLKNFSSGDINDASIIMQALVGDKKILYMGDAGINVQKEILKDISKVDIVKIPHQGSSKNFNKEFFEKLKPDYSVIPVGENSYGHPSLRVIRELERMGSKVYTTQINGDIIFEFHNNDIVSRNTL